MGTRRRGEHLHAEEDPQGGRHHQEADRNQSQSDAISRNQEGGRPPGSRSRSMRRGSRRRRRPGAATSRQAPPVGKRRAWGVVVSTRMRRRAVPPSTCLTRRSCATCMHSDALRCNPMSSDVIRCHRMSSDVISGHHTCLSCWSCARAARYEARAAVLWGGSKRRGEHLHALRCHQMSSDIIRCHRRSSAGITPRSEQPDERR